MEKRILAVIPARGGSKGLPGKNIRPLAGKPLIAYTIAAAKLSKHITRLVVSTDDRDIASKARGFGAEVVDRPAEFASDNAGAYGVVNHALESMKKQGEEFDIVIWLEPTSPLRKGDDIDRAIELFLKNFEKADSLVSLGKVELENPYIMKRVENGFVRDFIEYSGNRMRQSLPVIYFPYGVIYMSKTETFRKHKSFYQERTIPFFIARWQNYEINDIYDFVAIQAVMEHKGEA